jgi:hypothetical protein
MENLGYSMLIGAVNIATLVVEIATAHWASQ